MALLLCAVAVLIPLIITPGFLFYFDVTPKLAVLLIGTAIALPVVTGSKSSGVSIQTGSKVARWFAALLGIHAFSLLSATVTSAHWQLSLIGTNWRRFGLLSYLAVLAFAVVVTAALSGRPNRVRLLLRSISASGVVAAAYGTAQYLGWDPWLQKSAYVVGEGEWAIVRPPSTLGYASYAATFYLFAVFAGIGQARSEPARFWRIIGVLSAASGSLAILLSGTRAAILGLSVGAVFLIVHTRPRLTRRGIAIAALAIIAMAVFYVSPSGQKLRSRTRWYIEDVRGGARLLLWRDSLRMGAARPITGWGPETFSTEFPRFQSKELAQAYPDFYYESPHNIFIDAFVSTGILGLTALLALCSLGFHAAWIGRKTAPVEAAVLAAALAASIVAQQFTAFVVPTALYFYVTVAMLVSLGNTHTIANRRKFAAIAVSLALIAILVPQAVRLVAADRLLAQTSTALERGELSRAADLYRSARSWQPLEQASDLWYSRALARFAQDSTTLMPGVHALREGYAAALRASQTAEDRHNAFYNLATYCALRNDFAGLEANLRQAIQWAPNWFKPHWTFAQSLQLAGRFEEAEREAALAVELDGGKHPEVTRTLDQIRARRSRGNGTGNRR